MHNNKNNAIPLARRYSNILLLLAVLLGGCAYDNEQDLYPDIICDTQLATYQAVIVPIMTNYCLGCHSTDSNQGEVSLEGYDNLINYVNNGRLLGSIRHQSGFSAMPKDQPKIPACDIAKIEQWIASGAKND